MLKQLGHPSGITGRIILRLLNRVNGGMNEITLAALDLSEGDQVLETGFGGGALIASSLTSYKTVHVTGIDISALAVKTARKRFRNYPRANFEQSSDETLPADSASFTHVACANVIYFWSNIPLALSETHRVLTNGGKLVLSYSEGSPDGITRFDHKDVEAQLFAAGFTSVHSEQSTDMDNDTYYCTVALKAGVSPAE